MAASAHFASPGMPLRLTQSFSGLVREHLAQIEARLFVGVPRAGVIEEFKQQQGIDLGSLQSFPSALYRARQSARRLADDPGGKRSSTPDVDRLRPASAAAAAAVAASAEPHSPSRLTTPGAATLGSATSGTDATLKDPLEREFKYGAHDPRRIDEILRNPRDMEALRQRGLEMAREHAKKKT